MRPVLLIAGGSRGIGAACAMLAAARGYDVAVNYHSNSAAAADVVEACRSAGARAIALKGDMAREADIERVFAQAGELGQVTRLVHCAGVTGKNSRLDESDAAVIRAALDVNAFGALWLLRTAIRTMSTRHGGQGGSIVLLSSVAARLGGTNEYVWYAAAKGAVESMTVGAAREVAKEGIRINAVAPGPTDTEIHEPGRLDRITPTLPMGRVATPNEVAETILFLLSDAAAYITGTVLTVAGGR